MMARQWIFNFKWLQACGSHRRRERRRRRIRRAADDSTCGWVDTRKQTTFAEEEGEWVVAGAGLGAVYPALSCSDIVESTLSLTERENFETFLWPVRHTRSSKTCPRPTKSGWAPLSSAAWKYAIYTPHMCLLMWHALALCPVTVSHQSAAHARAHARREDNNTECKSHN